MKPIVNVEKFLNKHSGNIIGVGDIFDHSRSSVVGETQTEYLERTRPYWKHIELFIHGNHDSIFLRLNKQLPSEKVYINKNVLSLHGHQLQHTFDQAKIMKYERKFYTQLGARFSLFWEVEEWLCKTFNKYFQLHGKKAYAQAMNVLAEVDRAGLLTSQIDTVIVGHTHLPFDKEVKYNNKRYRVVNCGSSLHGKKFSPVFIDSIGKWFVSDLHIGTNKSRLN